MGATVIEGSRSNGDGPSRSHSDDMPIGPPHLQAARRRASMRQPDQRPEEMPRQQARREGHPQRQEHEERPGRDDRAGQGDVTRPGRRPRRPDRHGLGLDRRQDRLVGPRRRLDRRTRQGFGREHERRRLRGRRLRTRWPGRAGSIGRGSRRARPGSRRPGSTRMSSGRSSSSGSRRSRTSEDRIDGIGSGSGARGDFGGVVRLGDDQFHGAARAGDHRAHLGGGDSQELVALDAAELDRPLPSRQLESRFSDPRPALLASSRPRPVPELSRRPHGVNPPTSRARAVAIRVIPRRPVQVRPPSLTEEARRAGLDSRRCRDQRTGTRIGRPARRAARPCRSRCQNRISVVRFRFPEGIGDARPRPD